MTSVQVWHDQPQCLPRKAPLFVKLRARVNLGPDRVLVNDQGGERVLGSFDGGLRGRVGDRGRVVGPEDDVIGVLGLTLVRMYNLLLESKDN